MGPIDYNSMLTQLDLSPLLRGRQLQLQRQENQAQIESQQARTAILQQEADRKAAEDAAWQSWAQGSRGKDLTAADWSDAMLRFPDRFQQLKAASDAQTASQRTRNVQAAMNLGGLLNAGLKDQALANLKERRAALAEAGESTEITDAAISAVQKGDLATAKQIAGSVILGTLGEDGLGVMESIGWGPKAKKAEADAALEREKFDETKRHNRASEAAQVRDDVRADKKAAAGGKGGGKKGAGKFSDAQLDALIS